MKRILNTLYITNPDIYLSLDGENVIISENREVINRIPLHNLQEIVSFGQNGATPALMGKCASEGISLTFMDRNGRFLCRMQGEINGNVLLRRQQYRIADNSEDSLKIAQNMIAGKIYNSIGLMNRTARDHELRIDSKQFSDKTDMLCNSLKNCVTVADKDSLRGIEGEAASVYFSVFDDMIFQQKDDFVFSGRNKRPPKDNVNALLSFSYSLAANMCCSALEAVGLDPYVGVMHTDRPGRCSLALDLVEEFRAVMCDRFVLTLINKKMVTGKDFEKRENGSVIMSDNGRRTFLTAWQERKKKEIRHPFLDEKIEWGMLPYSQALLLARYIRGDIDSYPAFMWRC